MLFAKYGLNENGLNYGKNIFDPYTTAAKLIDNYTSQGLRTNLYYAETRVAYVINPKYNLRLELGGILRRERNDLTSKSTGLFTFGLRSSFRNLYSDF